VFGSCCLWKKYAVKAAEEAIAAISTVDYDSSVKIENAEKLYGILTDSEKEKVENRMALINAREEYDNLPPRLPEFEDDEILALYATSTINDYLLDSLKNPDSLVINSLTGGLYEEGTYIFEVDYSAQNGFGGSERERLYIAVSKATDGFSTMTYGDPYFYGGSNQLYTKQFFSEISPL